MLLISVSIKPGQAQSAERLAQTFVKEGTRRVATGIFLRLTYPFKASMPISRGTIL